MHIFPDVCLDLDRIIDNTWHATTRSLSISFFSFQFHLNVLHTDFPALKLFTVGCADRHRVCFDCIRQYVEDVMRKERKIAQCPMCPHAITHDEVKQLFPGDVDLIELSLEIQLKSTLANGNFIDCPTVDCKARFEKPDVPPPIASAASKKHQVVAAARVRVSNNTSHPLGCSLFFWWFFLFLFFVFVFFWGGEIHSRTLVISLARVGCHLPPPSMLTCAVLMTSSHSSGHVQRMQVLLLFGVQ